VIVLGNKKLVLLALGVGRNGGFPSPPWQMRILNRVPIGFVDKALLVRFAVETFYSVSARGVFSIQASRTSEDTM
jgi:hypothetical protein